MSVVFPFNVDDVNTGRRLILRLSALSKCIIHLMPLLATQANYNTYNQLTSLRCDELTAESCLRRIISDSINYQGTDNPAIKRWLKSLDGHKPTNALYCPIDYLNGQRFIAFDY